MVTRKQGGRERRIASRDLNALDSAELLEQAERRNRETAALLESARAVASSLDLGDVLGAILDQLGSIIEHTGASILLFRDDAVEFVEARSITGTRANSGARIPLEVAPDLIGAMRQGETVVIGDVRSDEPFAPDYRACIDAVGVRNLPPFNVIRSWMAVPLAIKDRVVGMLTISWTEPAFFTADHARLARAFADQAVVALENARLFEETERRAREMDALFRSDERLFRSLELDEVLQAIVDAAVDLLGAEKALVMTWDEAEGRLTPRAWRNYSSATIAFLNTPAAKTTPGVRPDRMTVEEDFVENVPEPWHGVLISEGVHHFAEVALISPSGRGLGSFAAAFPQDQALKDSDKRMLLALAERAVMAIENADLHARTYAQGRELAAVEERQRLARELHDSVSQALYGIALGARTAREQLERDPAKAAEPIDYVLSLAEAGMAEMRALIFELRPESLEKEGLVAAIKKHADAISARHEIQVSLDLCTEPDLPIESKEALYRICQEAMTNVIKHAHASKIEVQLVREDDRITLTVADDGIGFDPARDFPGHLGLHSMQERAERVGGHLAVEARPKKGAQVRATVHVR